MGKSAARREHYERGVAKAASASEDWRRMFGEDERLAAHEAAVSAAGGGRGLEWAMFRLPVRQYERLVSEDVVRMVSEWADREVSGALDETLLAAMWRPERIDEGGAAFVMRCRPDLSAFAGLCNRLASGEGLKAALRESGIGWATAALICKRVPVLGEIFEEAREIWRKSSLIEIEEAQSASAKGEVERREDRLPPNPYAAGVLLPGLDPGRYGRQGGGAACAAAQVQINIDLGGRGGAE